MDPVLLRSLLEQLEQAEHDHVLWHQNLFRVISCRLPPDDPAQLDDDGHLRCCFGRWYYEHPPDGLRAHPAFLAMEAEHKRLHRIAARMLRASADGAAVVPSDFDEYLIAREQMLLELESLKHEIEGTLSNRDPLTGVHRRADLLEDLRESLELVRRGIQDCCIAFMDLDRFKAINDTYGHRVGDQVLAAAVGFVSQHLRPFDKVYRYGGDEFVISMPGSDLAAGQAAVERIRKGLGAVALARDGATPIMATASFGVAMLDADLTVEEAIDNADKALLTAKATGRNRSCAWDPAATTQSILPLTPPDHAAGA